MKKSFSIKYIKKTPYAFFVDTCAIIHLESMNIWMYLVRYTWALLRVLYKMTAYPIFKHMDEGQSQIHISIVLEIIFQMSGRSLF